jgi:hypothetical protein
VRNQLGAYKYLKKDKKDSPKKSRKKRRRTIMGQGSNNFLQHSCHEKDHIDHNGL